jgi:hypothetical protein
MARDELARALAARVAAEPRCAVTRYLLACRCIDAGGPAWAVRHLMVAHHALPALESAALLVFAGLNWIARRDEPLLPVLLETWDEFRRPEFDRTAAECALLDAFAEPAGGLAGVSALARRLWRLPIQTLRAQIRAATTSRDAVESYPLLVATA